MYKQILVALGVISLLAACASEPHVETGANAEVIDGNLHKVDNSRTDIAYVDPDANFGKYNKILLTPLGVDNIEIIQPSSGGSIGRNVDWELTDKDKQNLQDAFQEAMVKQLETKGGYPIVTEAGDDVLQVSALLTGIAPSAAKDDNRSRPIGRSTVYTKGGGALAIVVGFADSQTGEVLALIKDSRSTNSYWGRNNSVSNMADVRRMFSHWAIQIRDGLDKVHDK